MRIALAQIDTTVGAFSANAELIVARARNRGHELKRFAREPGLSEAPKLSRAS